MRRTTLGPVTSSQLNTRNSIAPSSSLLQSHKLRQSIGPAIQNPSRVATRQSSIPHGQPPRGQNSIPSGQRSSISTNSRLSSVGNGTQRRSSVFNGRSSRTDPRPISDRAYINASIHSLINFLAERSYDHALSPKLLTRPTKKDFFNIINFLFHQIDPNFEIGEKCEDDVTTMLKTIKYPYGISKTALVAVGSPHTWPALLASLSWIIELLSYDEQVQAAEAEIDGDNAEKAFFEYLGNAYKSFLSGDDEGYTALETELASKIMSQNNILEDEVNAIRKRKAEVENEIQQIQKFQSSLPSLQAKKNDYISDLAKFRDLIYKLESHKESLNSKIQQREEEYNNQVQRLKSLNNDIKDICVKIDNQELSPADVAQLAKERAHLKEQIQTIANQREEVRKEIWNVEMEVSSKQEALEKLIQEYVHKATQLKLLPPNNKNANGKNYEIKENSILEHKNKIKTLLASFKESVVRKMNSARDQSSELQCDVEKYNFLCSEAEEEIRILEGKIKKVDDTHQREKEVLDKIVALKALETEDVEIEIQQRRDDNPLQQRLNRAIENLHKLAIKRQEMKKQFATEKSNLISAIKPVLFQAAEHQERIEGMLQSLSDHYSKKKVDDFSNQMILESCMK